MNMFIIWLFEKILSNKEIHRWIIDHLREIANRTPNTIDNELIDMLAEKLGV